MFRLQTTFLIDIFLDLVNQFVNHNLFCARVSFITQGNVECSTPTGVVDQAAGNWVTWDDLATLVTTTVTGLTLKR